MSTDSKSVVSDTTDAIEPSPLPREWSKIIGPPDSDNEVESVELNSNWHCWTAETISWMAVLASSKLDKGAFLP